MSVIIKMLTFNEVRIIVNNDVEICRYWKDCRFIENFDFDKIVTWTD